MSGWIGVDLDGTLARYEGWKGDGKIGEPIEAMSQRVREWLAQGKEVRIFTARAWEWETAPVGSEKTAMYKDQVYPIVQWAEKHFGQLLRVTCMKDYGMIELWDDRAIQVRMNTGERVGE